MNVAVTSLTDGEQGPGDGGGASGVTLPASKGVRGGGGLEEHKREEDEDLGPDAGLVGVRVHAKSLEQGEHDKDDRPWHQPCP